MRQLERCELAADSIRQNTRWLAEWLGLSEAQRKVLAFAATAESSRALSACLEPFKRLSSGLAIQLLGDVLGESIEQVRASLSPQSPLVRSGMLQFRPGRDLHHERWIGLESPFDEIFVAHYEQREELFAAVCPRASEPELGLGAFAHLYQVPDVGSDGAVLEGKHRLAALSTMQYLLHGGRPGLVLFDEIEDAFPWAIESGWLRQGSGSDKARTNRLLEENAVPCLWVGNRIGQLDPAFVRRFSLVLEVPAPPRKIREGMLAHYSRGLDVPAELRSRLAENAWVMPADVARAARVTRLVQQGLVQQGRAQETLSERGRHREGHRRDVRGGVAERVRAAPRRGGGLAARPRRRRARLRGHPGERAVGADGDLSRHLSLRHQRLRSAGSRIAPALRSARGVLSARWRPKRNAARAHGEEARPRADSRVRTGRTPPPVTPRAVDARRLRLRAARAAACPRGFGSLPSGALVTRPAPARSSR